MLREAAERTGDAVGDGTTTSTLLAHAIFSGRDAGMRGKDGRFPESAVERALEANVACLRELRE